MPAFLLANEETWPSKDYPQLLRRIEGKAHGPRRMVEEAKYLIGI